jgi:hypothetical protein
VRLLALVITNAAALLCEEQVFEGLADAEVSSHVARPV